ncbi:AI-2E family transporter [Chroococcidiopsis sp. CCMEE 29]|uniref:AI-2E family transporter n=1 Tax=Chroococcidiopsis sp. CCMEE 29 TaxID=155894 RepID=UPI002020E890|nr:AI-2E family transporter [Chroococcidiopsis sp. CCMEE 29]
MNLGQWLGLLALVISLYILWQVRQVLLLVFAAVVLATALNRLARRFQRSRLSRGWAVLLSFIILLTVIVGFFGLIVPTFANEFQQLIELFPKGLARSDFWVEQLRTRVPKQMTPYLPDVESLIQQLQPLASQLVQRSFTFFTTTFGFVLQFLLVLVLTLMLLSQPQPYRQAFIRLFPSFYRRRVDEILTRSEVALSRWLTEIVFSMTTIAVLSGIGLWLLGIPLVLAQAALAGILTFIPHIGSAMSVVPPIAIALLDDPWKSFAVLALYIGIYQLESKLLTPYFMVRQVSLLPAVTLFSQVFFATFFGFLGLLLALPLTIVGQVWLQEILIKDVLDQWGNNSKKTEIIFVSRPTESTTDEILTDSQVNQDNPIIDEGKKGNN